jgi:chorismate mutase/prephenate dehydrogenase
VEGLEELRRTLLSIDRAIVDLVAARLGIARSIERVKHATGLPIHDPRREIVVANLLAEEARKRGVPVELVRTLYFELARYSKCMQLKCPQGLRILFYGYGSMAETLARLAATAGCWTAVTGRNLEKAHRLAEAIGAKALEEEEALDWADIVIYTVPPHALIDIIEAHRRAYRESMLIADISSVKKPVVERVLEKLGSQGPEYASLHPLFGPLECPYGETIAVVPIRLERWKAKLEELLVSLGLTVVYVDPNTHDKVMAVNQVLHHLIHELYMVAREVLARELGIDQQLVKILTTHSLKKTLAVQQRLQQLGRVVEEIRRLNPYTADTIQAIHKALSILEGAVEK